MVGKGKGSCFDKPGPNYKYVADMREDAQRCEKCRTGSVGQPHRVWCENRDTFKRKEEKELADKLQLEIEAYQAWYAENGASDAAGPSGLPLLLPERVLPLADAPVTTTTTTAATTTATTATTIGVGAAATAVVLAVSSSLVASTELGKRNAALLHAADKSDFRCIGPHCPALLAPAPQQTPYPLLPAGLQVRWAGSVRLPR